MMFGVTMETLYNNNVWDFRNLIVDVMASLDTLAQRLRQLEG